MGSLRSRWKGGGEQRGHAALYKGRRITGLMEPAEGGNPGKIEATDSRELAVMVIYGGSNPPRGSSLLSGEMKASQTGGRSFTTK